MSTRIEQFAADNATQAGLRLEIGNPSVTQVHVDGYRYEATIGCSDTAVEVFQFGNAQLALNNFAAWETDPAAHGGSAIVIDPGMFPSSGAVLSGSNWSIRSDKYQRVLNSKAVSGGLDLDLDDLPGNSRITSLDYYAGSGTAWADDLFMGESRWASFDAPVSAIKLRTGNGAPIGAAPIGSLYLRQDCGDGTTFYVYEPGG